MLVRGKVISVAGSMFQSIMVDGKIVIDFY